MKDLQIIAFYLPQFHPFKENDKWWGKGFTEWTNVGKARPLFKGHNQPRVPTELGYYDLRLPIIREQQVQMARDAGVTAFCYWHYWFGNGKSLIPEVFDEVLNTGKPDFPFCLGWANHSWYSKNWNADGTVHQKILMEQTYPGIEDEQSHFQFFLKAFNDPRYVKIDGCPLLYIFDPISLPEEMISNFRRWAKEYGFPGLYLVGRIAPSNTSPDDVFSKGFDAISFERIQDRKYNYGRSVNDKIVHKLQIYKRRMCGLIKRRPPFMADYSKIYKSFITPRDFDEDVIPVIIPQWDHTPRSGWNGILFVNATPQYFYYHVKDALNSVSHKRNKIIFLKSWNEWGEGNMMEPDLTYGRGFINALRKAVDEE